MKKLIQAIIDKWFCKHKWEVDAENYYYDSDEAERPYQIDTIIVCTNCGRRALETTLQ